MKKMKFKLWEGQKMHARRNDMKFEFPAELEELSSEETKRIVAGEGIAFWLGYAAGKIANLFS
ncbi:MAG TPA: hypothetical protein VFI33_09125 [Puia sp.]|nr:hypothetical protein [Puia sp.]